jgi:WD40 repeat protein
VQAPADWTKGNGIQQISRDGKTALLIDGQQLTIRAIELPSGRVAWTNESDERERGATTYGQRLSLSPDGRVLLHFVRRISQPSENSGGEGGIVQMQCRVIDPAGGKEVRRFDVPNETYFAVSWSPDSKRIAYTPGSGFGFNRSSQLTHIINVETGKVELSLAAPPGGFVGLHQVVFSPDGRRFAGRETESGPSAQTKIKVWDAADGTEMLALPPPAGAAFVAPEFDTQMAFSADGLRLLEFVPEGGFASARREDQRYATVRVIDATPPERKQR